VALPAARKDFVLKGEPESYDCEKRALVRLFDFGVPLPEQTCYQACPHNIESAAVERHFAPVPQWEKGLHYDGLPMLKQFLRKNGFYPGSVEPWSPEQVVRTRAPAKRDKYRRAFESLAETGLLHNHGIIGTMVKFEKHDVAKTKPPRLIHFRTKEYTAYVAQSLAPFEKELYASELNGFPVFAKHMNSYQRGEAVAAMFGEDRTYVMLDHKQFDGHISVDHLSLEHAVYNWIFQDAELRDALRSQLNNRCYSREGYYYKVKGGRMSGDFNTSLGNNIINLTILMLWLRHLGVPREEWRILLDGDDCVLNVPTKYVSDLKLDFFELYGFEVTLEGTCKEPEHVSFCQTKPIYTGDGWRMTRAYERACGRMQYTIRKQRGIGWVRLARGIAESERQLGDGIPIFGALGKRLCEVVPEVRPLADDEYYRTWREPAYTGKEVTTHARASFALAWDIMPGEQMALERYFATASLADPLLELWAKERQCGH